MRRGARFDLGAFEILRLAQSRALRDQRIEVRARDAELLGGPAELESMRSQRREQPIVIDRPRLALRAWFAVRRIVETSDVVTARDATAARDRCEALRN